MNTNREADHNELVEMFNEIGTYDRKVSRRLEILKSYMALFVILYSNDNDLRDTISRFKILNFIDEFAENEFFNYKEFLNRYYSSKEGLTDEESMQIDNAISNFMEKIRMPWLTFIDSNERILFRHFKKSTKDHIIKRFS